MTILPVGISFFLISHGGSAGAIASASNRLRFINISTLQPPNHTKWLL